MRLRLLSSRCFAASTLNGVLCLLAIVAMLALSLTPAHNGANHFRSPEVRRSVRRHMAVSPAEQEAPEAVANPKSQPVALVPPDDDRSIKFIVNIEPDAERPFIQRLRRLKLGSRSKTPDPFI